jgi:uncharacterized membrane protein
MKLSIGELPEHHDFLLITRPVTEWTFKVVGWILIVSTIKYAYDKTGNEIIFVVYLILFLFLLSFFGGFVRWLLSFRLHRTVTGEAFAGGNLRNSPERTAPEKKTTALWAHARNLFAYMLALVFMIFVFFVMNVAVEKAIDAFIEAQKIGHEKRHAAYE